MSLEATPSDRDLADAVRRSGDERAFRILYRRHTPRLYALVLRLGGDSRPEADDVVQESWIRAVEGLDRFRWDSSFATWLLGIGVNVTRDLLRRNSRRLETPWDDDVDAPLAAVPAGDRVDLERAIATLPDGARTVLVLHDVEGWPHETIAERLGISVGTTKSQLHRARRALRAWLAPEPGGRRT